MEQGPSSMVKQVVVVKAEQPSLIPAEESVSNVAEFFGRVAEVAAPTEGPGSEQFEQEVREAMGAPEPLSEAPRLVRHDDPDPKAKGKGKKSGPAELKAFHEKEVAAGRVN